MYSRLHTVSEDRQWVLSQAASDFYFFQNRGYPRSSALEWVGNRYQLPAADRDLLHRGVFGQRDALRRRAKLCRGAEWLRDRLVVDGHNVQITVESVILGRPVLLANDGALRDIAGQSARFRLAESSEMAMDIILRFLNDFPPREVLFLFDDPMSHSGHLASLYRQRMKVLGIEGDALTSPVPEKEFPLGDSVVASSDHAVLDEAVRWLDLAHAAVDANSSLELTVDFSSVLLANSAANPTGLSNIL